MLTINQLACERNGKILFSGLDFVLLPSQILHIIGPNGCGKSTLLEALVGLFAPQHGQINWQGATEADYPFMYIGHKIGVKKRLTVLENLRIAASLVPVSRQLDWEDILQQFELDSLKNMICSQLSEGQCQRVALTRLILSDAPLWILDEPFTSLDAAAALQLQKMMIKHLTHNGMIILTGHHPIDFSEEHTIHEIILPVFRDT